MSKKILFLAVLLTGMLFSINYVSAACSIWRYKSDVKNVKVNESLNGDDVPVVAIGWSRDHTEDLIFYAQLSGAEWDYGNSGTIQNGVTYNKINKTTLEIIVDVGTGSDEINFGGGRNIYLPINCTIKDAGEIRVLIDGNETTVSSGNVLIAKAIDGRLTVHGNKAGLNQSGQLKKITVTDTSTQSYKANQKFTLELDTGFHFTGDVNITGTGKFDNLVKFDVDKSNSAKAYITITGDTPKTSGEIILEGIGVTRKSDSKFSVVLLKTTFTASMVPLNSSLAVASYNKEAETLSSTTTAESTTETTTAETTSKTTIETTVKQDPVLIKIQIGANGYTIDNNVYPLDVPAYISNGSTMLPLRALANAMGISDDDISYDAQSKTASLSPNNLIEVSITAGENKIDISSNGLDTSMEISTPAQITNGRLFLPLRAMANALGISDSAVSYDAATKTVTIEK